MRTIIAKQCRAMGDFYCEITNYMDNLLLEEYLEWIAKKYTRGSYFHYSGDKDNVRAFRFPGATRGHVCFTEDGIIEKFVVYDDNPHTKCYVSGAEELLDAKYIGTKVIFEKK